MYFSIFWQKLGSEYSIFLCEIMVGPRKAESQMAKGKKAEKIGRKRAFQHLAEYANGRISIGRIRIKWTSSRARSFQST
jgi:hypothetical protein